MYFNHISISGLHASVDVSKDKLGATDLSIRTLIYSGSIFYNSFIYLSFINKIKQKTSEKKQTDPSIKKNITINQNMYLILQ
jgi:hypothetical protein